MRFRSLHAVLIAAVAVLFVGAVIASGTGDALRPSGETSADARPCIIDVRCGGQTATVATGPLVPPQGWSVLVAIAAVGAAALGGRDHSLHDRLAGSRLFRPPRLAA